MNRAMRPPLGGACQRGQSTVEFLVLATVLVPLFIAVPLIGKYIDLMQTAEQASRYVAFEGTARNSRSSWKTDADLSKEVRRRFFSNPDAPVKTGDEAGDFNADRNPVWLDHQGEPLLADFSDDVTVQTKVDNRNALPTTAPYRSELRLSNANFYNGMVTVKPDNVTNFPPFDLIDLSITRRTSLLADAWTGFSSGDIRRRIERSVLMFPIGPAKDLVNVIGTAPTVIFDPALVVGEFDWDVVPCDRLIGGCR